VPNVLTRDASRSLNPMTTFPRIECFVDETRNNLSERFNKIVTDGRRYLADG
jgi:hypothetical protein